MSVARICLLVVPALFVLASPAIPQPAAQPVKIGFLGPVGINTPGAAFVEALRGAGYVDGRNLTIVSRAAKTSNRELPELAAELVGMKPDVLVAMSTPPVLALQQATATIPIVMIHIGNPIATGLIQSYAHPGGNITGTANEAEEWAAKRLQMVAEVMPGIRCLLYPRNPSNPAMMAGEARRRVDAQKLGFELRMIDAATPEQLDRVLAARPEEECGAALFLPLDGLFFARGSQIVEFALHYKIALFVPWREAAEAGALMSFGINTDDQWRLGATYVDKILNGAKPADLPVQLPTKFEIVVNLKTAKALGLTIPPAVLVQADNVIE